MSLVVRLSFVLLSLGFCHCGWFSFITTHKNQTEGQENYKDCSDVDILQALNVSDELRGVGVSHGPRPLPGLPAWRLHAPFDHVQLPASDTKKLLKRIKNQLSLQFVFRQHRKTVATLLSINSPGKMSPWLRLTSNLKHGHLVLFYRIREDGKLHEKLFPLPRPFNWTQLAFSIDSNVITLYLDCNYPQRQHLAGNIDLKFPDDSLVYFRQEPGFKKKLLGTVQVAQVSPKSLTERPWKCDHENSAPEKNASSSIKEIQSRIAKNKQRQKRSKN